MKFLNFVFFCFLIISCNNNKQNKNLNRHNPYEHIDQNIENENAIELYYEGLDFFEEGNFESAIESFSKSFEIEKNPIILNELGTIELKRKKYSEAIKYYNQGRKLDKYYWPIYINEARTHAKLSEFEEAERILALLKKLCKSDYWIAYSDYLLATIHFLNGQDCVKVFDFLEKSKNMASDSELSKSYLKFKKHVEKNCG